MNRLALLLVLVVSSGVGAISDAPAPSPVPPNTIILPITPVPQPPVPVPVPNAVTSLTGTQCYAFQVIGAAEVWSFPENLLAVTSEAIPAGETHSYTDTFFDGTTTVRFKGPCTAYFVRAATGVKGTSQLSIVAKTPPVTVKRVTFDVNGGQPPTPPPDPPVPPVPPKPDPAKVDSVYVIVVESAVGPRTVELAKFLNDPYWLTLRPKHDWRHYMNNSPTAIQNNYVSLLEEKDPTTNAVVGFPGVLLLDAKTGKLLSRFKATTIPILDAAVKAVSK